MPRDELEELQYAAQKAMDAMREAVNGLAGFLNTGYRTVTEQARIHAIDCCSEIINDLMFDRMEELSEQRRVQNEP